MVARQATEQIMDLRYTLRMMGIPLDGPAWMFGDNQSVITSSTIPHSNLNKRHNALSYHRVREAIASKVLYFIHVDGKHNPSDILTKFLSWANFWPLIQPLLFWKGDTIIDAHPTTPMSEIIGNIKNLTTTGKRGVTSRVSGADKTFVNIPLLPELPRIEQTTKVNATNGYPVCTSVRAVKRPVPLASGIHQMPSA